MMSKYVPYYERRLLGEEVSEVVEVCESRFGTAIAEQLDYLMETGATIDKAIEEGYVARDALPYIRMCIGTRAGLADPKCKAVARILLKVPNVEISTIQIKEA